MNAPVSRSAVKGSSGSMPSVFNRESAWLFGRQRDLCLALGLSGLAGIFKAGAQQRIAVCNFAHAHRQLALGQLFARCRGFLG